MKAFNKAISLFLDKMTYWALSLAAVIPTSSEAGIVPTMVSPQTRNVAVSVERRALGKREKGPGHYANQINYQALIIENYFLFKARGVKTLTKEYKIALLEKEIFSDPKLRSDHSHLANVEFQKLLASAGYNVSVAPKSEPFDGLVVDNNGKYFKGTGGAFEAFLKDNANELIIGGKVTGDYEKIARVLRNKAGSNLDFGHLSEDDKKVFFSIALGASLVIRRGDVIVPDYDLPLSYYDAARGFAVTINGHPVELDGYIRKHFSVKTLPVQVPEAAKQADHGENGILMVAPNGATTYGSLSRSLRLYQQWDAVRSTLMQSGVPVQSIEARDAASAGYSALWVRDAYFEYNHKIFVPNRFDPQVAGIQADLISAQKENVHFVTSVLEKRGYTPVKIDSFFEAGNLLAHPSGAVFFGFDPALDRSAGLKTDNNPNLVSALKSEIGANVLMLELINPECSVQDANGKTKVIRPFYHLDTCLSFLLDGEILVYPDALTPESYANLRKTIPTGHFRELTKEEALEYSTNNFSGRRLVVAPHLSPRLRKEFADEGLTLLTPEDVGLPPGTFDISNSSVHCLTNSWPLPISSQFSSGKGFPSPHGPY